MSHPQRAAEFVARRDRARWHDQALWFLRGRRDRAASSLPEWEALRERASAIKLHLLSRLPEYLEEFERNAIENGAKVHWARDGEEVCSIVHGLLESRGARRVVKSKSMLTEECHLNPYLEARGIEVVDTDLGERIVQWRKEPPSHIVMPAIHLKRAEIGELFHERLGTAPGLDDPIALTEAARAHLRAKFLAADAGITGVNFAVAETGGIVVCTNEGNADLGASLPKLHIACMGLEKLVPRAPDLAVFLRLLARSATGQAITAYTSHFHAPAAGGELHIVIVDNGRSDLLAHGEFARSLACIRCGACMNTCPVFRRSGGHSYGTTVPGPIGSILAPLRHAARYASLPSACSLCGSCTDVCPVKIDLHHQLLHAREHLASRGHLPAGKRAMLAVLGAALSRPWLFRFGGALARLALRALPRSLVHANAWGRQRELPPMPGSSFREQWKERRGRRA